MELDSFQQLLNHRTSTSGDSLTSDNVYQLPLLSLHLLTGFETETTSLTSAFLSLAAMFKRRGRFRPHAVDHKGQGHTHTHTHTHTHHRPGRPNRFPNWWLLMGRPLVLPQIQVINVTPCLTATTHTHTHTHPRSRTHTVCVCASVGVCVCV